MKKLLILVTFISSMIMSSVAHAEWTKVSKNIRGMTFYVDFERIRKHGGYVYYWDLGDYLTPMGNFKNLSVINYNQVDCVLMRRKILTQIQYKGKMGTGQKQINNIPDENWTYPPPNSSAEDILKAVCNHKSMQ